jgi:adenine deaminase
MDKGVDFIKYGGTTHMGLSLPIFSDRAQRAIVEEAHKRGVRVETHATSPEALRSALEAGVDLVQHPEEVGMPDDGSNLSDSLVAMFIRRGVICAINPWDQRVQSVRNDNRKKFIRAGCTMAVASDDREMGEATLKEIRGLVSSGMTPMGALVAATRNGALASGMLDQLGTVEAGKLADLVVLRADPVSDIENVRKDQIAMVFKEGARVDDVLKRDAVYEDYAQSIQRGWAFSSVKGLTLTDKQWSSIEKVKRRYATQMLILIADSLGRGKDSTNNKRRVAELVARQIGASRTILTSAQQAVFDPKAQEWLKLRMAEGCSVTIPGLQP